MGRVRAAAARLGLLCAAGFYLASCADTPPPAPPPPEPATLWPTNGWQTSTPEAQGIDSKWLNYAVQTIQYKHLPVNSLLVERHGYIVLDAYFSGTNQQAHPGNEFKGNVHAHRKTLPSYCCKTRFNPSRTR